MTDREARRGIHHRLIDLEHRPCSICSAEYNLIIHRIRPGVYGGKYTIKNSQVLCIGCHREVHNHSKFNIGDKVQINGRCPHFLLQQIRHNRTRTITSIYYDADRQCCYYHLGQNYQGSSDEIEAYPFRSYQLIQPIDRGPGRPRQKRKYRKHNSYIKCTAKPSNQKIEREIDNKVLYHSTMAVTALKMGVS